MSAPLETEVFRIGDDVYNWLMLLAAPELSTFWQDARSEAMSVRQTDDDDSHELGVAFRRARRLIAADDLRSWLSWWGITVSQWRATLVELDSSVVDHSSPTRSGVELDQWTWQRIVISGHLEAELQHFAADKAAKTLVEEDSQHVGDDDSALERVLRDSINHAEVQAEFDRRRVDWTTVDVSSLRLGHLDAALEARLCMDADGESLTDVADLAGTRIERTTVTLGQLDSTHRAAVLSAELQTPVGPLVGSHGAEILFVHDRRVPSPTDESAWRAAAEIVADRVRQRLLDTYVTWSLPD